MKNLGLVFGYYLTALFFLFAVFGLFPELNPVLKQTPIIFIAEFASIIFTGLILMLAYEIPENDKLSIVFKFISAFGVIWGVLFVLVWVASLLIFTFSSVTVFVYFIFSALFKMVIIFRIKSLLEFRHALVIHFISIFVMGLSVFAGALLFSPFFCPGDKCYVADAMWGFLYFFLLGTGTIYLINNVFTKENFQEEVAKFLPKVLFGTMIAVGLMFVIFASLIFLSASNPDLLAVKKSPCQNNVAIEEWNECVSTKEYYPRKAFETKDLQYCDSIRKIGRRLGNGVVVDSFYKWRFPLVFDQWSELLKLFLSTSLLIFFQMTGLQSL